jgi:hypothetical protein
MGRLINNINVTVVNLRPDRGALFFMAHGRFEKNVPVFLVET